VTGAAACTGRRPRQCSECLPARPPPGPDGPETLPAYGRRQRPARIRLRARTDSIARVEAPSADRDDPRSCSQSESADDSAMPLGMTTQRGMCTDRAVPLLKQNSHITNAAMRDNNYRNQVVQIGMSGCSQCRGSLKRRSSTLLCVHHDLLVLTAASFRLTWAVRSR
jgi:hypothetical protein